MKIDFIPFNIRDLKTTQEGIIAAVATITLEIIVRTWAVSEYGYDVDAMELPLWFSI